MAKTITISEEAYSLLKKNKAGKQSFSDVIKRELGERIFTVDEYLAMIKPRNPKK